MRNWIDRVLIASVLGLFMGGIVLTNAHAGALDLFIGIDPPLKKRIDLIHAGVVVDDNFRVRKYCAYEFTLRILHNKKMMDEYGIWDRYRADKKALPIQVHLAVSRVKKGVRESIFDGDVLARVSGGNLDMTFLRIIHIILDKGDYQVSLNFLHDTPELKGVQADFVIGIRPKTSCPHKP